MPAYRYFYDGLLPTNENVQLDPVESHHLVKVMRVQKDEVVELINGQGVLAQARVLHADQRATMLLTLSSTEALPDRPKIILVQALPRPARLDTIVEKATELGVFDLWLFPGERSEKKELSNKQVTRCQKLAIAAMKQCGRLYLPSIELKPPLSRWETVPHPSFFGDLRSQAPLLWNLIDTREEQIAYFVGPEAGFSIQEIDILTESGAQGTRLHQLTLRTDTAPLVALSLIHHRLLVAISDE